MPFDLPSGQTSAPRILVIDPDPAMIDGLRRGFAGNDLYFEQVGCASEARTRLLAEDIDLATLELDLPDANGIDFLRDIRSLTAMPVLVATARPAKLASVLCLELGADDYVLKPADPDEINARIRAILRRRGPGSNVSPGLSEAMTGYDSGKVEFAGWHFDMAGLNLRSAQGRAVHITATEAALLRYFVCNDRRPLTRAEINRQVHGQRTECDDRSIDVLVKKLRAKFAAHAPDLHAIRSVRGVGYIFSLDVHVVA